MADQMIVNREKTFQTIEGFGTSGAWWAQMVGGWTHPDEESGLPVRERIAQLLFDKDKGLGIGIYRYNLGGGSAQSGRGTYHHEIRRAESFDAGENEYDWNRDANAVWMLREAVRLGVGDVVFFVNSPIERLTKNHKAQLDIPFTENLRRRDYKKFADYCLNVTEHFVREGVPIRHLSPVNEPLWIWTGKNGQEGCHYHPWSLRPLFRVFADEMKKRPALKAVRLSGAENGDIRFLNKAYTKAVIKNDWLDGLDTHSYNTKLPFGAAINDSAAFKRRYRRWLDKKYPGTVTRTSEWCHMQGGRDYTMSSALEQARIMYEDLSILNVASFQLWIAVSEVDYCDGIIYVDEKKKTFDIPKRYYAFGQFTKFIREGAKRVDVSSDNETIKTLAFDNGDSVAVIVINPSESEQTVSLKGAKEIFVTDKNQSLERHEIDGVDITISPLSVSTVIIKE